MENMSCSYHVHCPHELSRSECSPRWPCFMGETNCSSEGCHWSSSMPHWYDNSAFQRTWKEIAWKKRLVVPFVTTMKRLYAFHVWFWLQTIFSCKVKSPSLALSVALSWNWGDLTGVPGVSTDSIKAITSKHNETSQQLHEQRIRGIKLAITQFLSEKSIIWHHETITVQYLYQQCATQCLFNKRTFVKSSAGGNVNLCFT